MSTRCQVQVIQQGMDWEEKVTLYHHCDGYPTNMLPLIEKAYNEHGKGWEGSRAGKVASFLCAVDPGQFEPEEGHALHGDIEFYYQLIVGNHRGQGLAWESTWQVVVYVPRNFGSYLDKKKPTMKDLKAVGDPMPISQAASIAGDIERQAA